MSKLETATLAGGCFWCTEAIFKRLKGVESVRSGFSGGSLTNPTYEDVAMGDTGHAECIQIQFDPSIISYEQLLDVFFHLHDPTTLNRQGIDVGTEYRSAIFYHTKEQKKKAEEAVQRVNDSQVYSNPVVTEITKYKAFYEADESDQDFYNSGRRPDYCRLVIDPKIQKLYKNYSKIVKEEAK